MKLVACLLLLMVTALGMGAAMQGWSYAAGAPATLALLATWCWLLTRRSSYPLIGARNVPGNDSEGRFFCALMMLPQRVNVPAFSDALSAYVSRLPPTLLPTLAAMDLEAVDMMFLDSRRGHLRFVKVVIRGASDGPLSTAPDTRTASKDWN